MSVTTTSSPLPAGFRIPVYPKTAATALRASRIAHKTLPPGWCHFFGRKIHARALARKFGMATPGDPPLWVRDAFAGEKLYRLPPSPYPAGGGTQGEGQHHGYEIHPDRCVVVRTV